MASGLTFRASSNRSYTITAINGEPAYVPLKPGEVFDVPTVSIRIDATGRRMPVTIEWDEQ